MKRKIGQASLEYVNGKVAKASFKPTWDVDFDKEFIGQLKNNPKFKDPEALQWNADMVLAGWFNQVSNIELADRDQVTIISEQVECDKDLDGFITLCVLDYYVVTKEDTANEEVL